MSIHPGVSQSSAPSGRPEKPTAHNNPVLDLLRREGFYGLSGYDGCACGSCEVHSVHIDVSCRKSSGSACGTLIRVWSHHMDMGSDQIVNVGRWMLAEMVERQETTPITVRFCEFEKDRDQACIYCGHERDDPNAYLCVSCNGKVDVFGDRVADRYAFPHLVYNPDDEP